MKDKKKIIIISVMAVVIITSAIICRTHPFNILPLMISLFVMVFQSEANRYAVLAGSLNSLIYAAVYLNFGIYGSVLQAALFSFPIQLITFIRWNKNAYKHTVMFKKMSVKGKAFLYGGVAAAWIAMCIVLNAANYEFAVLDSGSTLLGFVIPFFTMLAYVEYTYLWLVQGVFVILLNIQLVMSDYSKTPYLLYSIYSAYCIVMAFINVHKFYKEQQEVKANDN